MAGSASNGKAPEAVLVAVRDGIVAWGLSHALRRVDLDVVVPEESHGPAILAAARRHRPRLAVIGLPFEGGADAVGLIESLLGFGVRSLVLASAVDLPMLGQCLEQGAVGIASKVESLDAVCEKIRAALEDEPVNSDGEREDMLAAARARRDEENRRFRPFRELSEREREILFLLTEGLCAEAVARQIYVSTSTVRMHIQRILRKLEVNSQLAAVAKAHAAGWARADLSA